MVVINIDIAKELQMFITDLEMQRFVMIVLAKSCVLEVFGLVSQPFGVESGFLEE